MSGCIGWWSEEATECGGQDAMVEILRFAQDDDTPSKAALQRQRSRNSHPFHKTHGKGGAPGRCYRTRESSG